MFSVHLSGFDQSVYGHFVSSGSFRSRWRIRLPRSLDFYPLPAVCHQCRPCCAFQHKSTVKRAGRYAGWLTAKPCSPRWQAPILTMGYPFPKA